MNKKYKLDYYQREYKWETLNIVELVEDLSSRFLQSYDKEHYKDVITIIGINLRNAKLVGSK